jgi:hypothetical protein
MLDIAFQRLHNQHLLDTKFANPCDVVTWLGAVQAQDYAGGKWAVGLRLQNANDDAVEQALTDGAILRTHIMRPTWHFVAPADIRWMLALTAPRVNAASAYWYRQLELNDELIARTNAIIANTLQGGKHLTRTELGTAFKEAGIVSDDFRVGYIMFRAEQDGLVCSGARKGKQQTYALLDERVPQTRTWERDEALAELTRRYFTSHGPATIKDFVWWSGLTVADTKAGLDMVGSQLLQETIGDQTYWFAASEPPSMGVTPVAHLLPNYDEYIIGYTDRSAALDTQHTEKLDARGNVLFNYTIVVDGKVVGIWKRTFRKREVVITLTPISTLSAAEEQAVSAALHRYGEFLGMTVVLSEASGNN